MKKFKDWKLFSKLLFLTSGLGILPLVAIIVLFVAPVAISPEQFKLFLGMLLMTIPIATLCLAALISSAINSTLHTLLKAQRRFRVGDFRYRISLVGAGESVSLYRGFNAMSELVHKAYERLLQQKKDEALTQQAVQVVHDLAGPLHSINVAHNFLTKQKCDIPYFADHVQLLELGTKRLQGVADGLLNRYKTESNERGQFFLHDVIQSLVEEYRLQSSNIEFVLVETQDFASLRVNGSQTRLQRAFANIIKNAIEAMHGKGEIKIQMCRDETGTDPNRVYGLPCDARGLSPGTVLITITDTGPGMSEETLQKVLQGGHTEGKSDGHGIGTKVIREVVQEFGGHFSAESVLGEGSTFIIRLPLSTPE